MTDIDIFAILCREPFALSWKEYITTPDFVILHGYLAARDKDQNLITIRERMGIKGPLTGDPWAAELELPTDEELAIPAECFTAENSEGRPIPAHWIRMYWQVHRSRNETTEEIEEKFWTKVGGRG